MRFDAIVTRRDGERWVALPIAELMRHFREAMKLVPDRRKADTYCRTDIVLKMLVDVVGAHPEQGTAKFAGTVARAFFVPTRSEMRQELVRQGYLDALSGLDVGDVTSIAGSDDLNPWTFRGTKKH